MVVFRHISSLQFNNLSNVFPEPFIGRGESKAWPACCTDLNRLDFCLWDHIMSLDGAEVSDVQYLKQRIQNGFGMIRKASGILQRVRQPPFRRAKPCDAAQRG